MPHGNLVKRHQLPLPKAVRGLLGGRRFYDKDDLAIGKDLEIYARTYHIVDCDAFTRKFMGVQEEAQRESSRGVKKKRWRGQGGGKKRAFGSPMYWTAYPNDMYTSYREEAMARESGADDSIDRRKKLYPLKKHMEVSVVLFSSLLSCSLLFIPSSLSLSLSLSRRLSLTHTLSLSSPHHPQQASLTNAAPRFRDGDTLKKFLESDGKVLSFEAKWNEGANGAVSWIHCTVSSRLGWGSNDSSQHSHLLTPSPPFHTPFTPHPNPNPTPAQLNYFPVDDSIQVVNRDKSQFPLLLKRQKVPKAGPATSSSAADQPHLTWKDFYVGKSLHLLGREVLLCNCDSSVSWMRTRRTGEGGG